MGEGGRIMDFFKILNGGIGVSMSNFDRLWAKKYSGWPETELTGLLPLSFLSKGEALTDYRIYGTENGAGVQTENLFDKNNTEGIEDNYYIDRTTGNKVSNPQYYISAPIAVASEETYWWTFRITSGGAAHSAHSAPSIGFFDANDNQIGVVPHSSGIKSFPFTTPANCAYIKASVYKYDIDEEMLTSGSTAPTSYIPYGYKIPISDTSGVTENLWDENYDTSIPDRSIIYVPLYVGTGEFTCSTTTPKTGTSPDDAYNARYIFLLSGNVSSGAQNLANGVSNGVPRTVSSSNGYVTIAYRWLQETGIKPWNYQTMLNVGSTALPYVPHRYETNYDLFIGSTKLGADEYLDFGEQKVYKYISGTLTPTDPPAPFPPISTYKGENTLSSSETVGEVTIEGRIKEIP